MRHRKHSNTMGVKKEHREAIMANMAASLFSNGYIKTTLSKAKALKPFAERIITLAKLAKQTDDVSKQLHFRRKAISKVRDKLAVKTLFDLKVKNYLTRQGGYCRIFKLVPRRNAIPMALLEIIDGT